MRKNLAAGMAALTFGGAIATAAIPAAAEARPYHGGYHGYYGGYRHHDNGAAIVAGVAGLAIGAALASGNHHSYYRGGYYDYGYAPGYYDYGYRTCESRRWVWDPYIGRRVLVTSHYAC
jgi:hypothetical protein